MAFVLLMMEAIVLVELDRLGISPVDMQLQRGIELLRVSHQMRPMASSLISGIDEQLHDVSSPISTPRQIGVLRQVFSSLDGGFHSASFTFAHHDTRGRPRVRAGPSDRADRQSNVLPIQREHAASDGLWLRAAGERHREHRAPAPASRATGGSPRAGARSMRALQGPEPAHSG